jgi:hypothetical protein
LKNIIINSDLNNELNKIELKLDYYNLKNEKINVKSNLYLNIQVSKIYNDKLPINNQPRKNQFILVSNFYKKKILQPTKYTEISKIIITISSDKKYDSVIVTIDGVEFKGVKFISISPNIFPKLQFAIKTFANIENVYNLNETLNLE